MSPYETGRFAEVTNGDKVRSHSDAARIVEQMLDDLQRHPTECPSAVTSQLARRTNTRVACWGMDAALRPGGATKRVFRSVSTVTTFAWAPCSTGMPAQHSDERTSVMKSRPTYTAIATLAVISALALSGGPAFAAAPSPAVSGGTHAQLALTPAECAGIQDEIAFLKSLRALAQAELPTATPSQRADLIREIRSLTAEIKSLSKQYDDECAASLVVDGTPLPGTPLPA